MMRRLFTDPSGIARAIIIGLLRDDHPEQWSRAEIERELHDVEPLAVNEALERLHAIGVVRLNGENVCAVAPVHHLNDLGMVAI